ncbi:hypothetical protein A9G11_08410 [Gilliamella sp. wkB108]|uniref:hypothetical protein n=1 Tax=Gilliamella sp. wkB108 TaxID=3120256 RepID=UPI00080E0DA6|nr:hypothetical protein [Gilliamella apicola]OCG21151.1 hypothetical protein A9G11_08410 [Gilliamella apicola]
MSWYTTGSVNLTNGSKTVTGVGTKWTNPLIGICAGQMLILKTKDTIEICEIASVQSDTQLTLANKYAGVTKTGVNYEIPTAPNVSVEHLALLISEMLNYYQQQMEGWQTVLTGQGEVTLTAPDGRIVTIKSQYSIQDELIKLVEKGKNFSEITIKNAELSNNASQSAKNSESSAKTSADNAAKFADSASQSAKNAGNSATSAKTAETGAQTSATEAKQSALDAKNWASTVDLKKHGIGNRNLLSDVDSFQLNGFGFVDNSTIGNKPFDFAEIIQSGDSKSESAQIALDLLSNRVKTRSGRLNIWNQWCEFMTTNNTNADTVGALPAVKTGANNAPIYKVGNQVNFDLKPKIAGTEPIYIIESYQNGDSWYNVYSNGFIEQSSVILSGTDEIQKIKFMAINLLKPMKTKNYGVSVDLYSNGGPWGWVRFACGNINCNSFILCSYTEANPGATLIRWTVRGY